jgi:hypothetical protein
LLTPLLAVGLAAQAPVKVAYECTAEDVETFGLNCNTGPCPVFLELSSADVSGGRILVTGNLHTQDRTLFSILLMSDDNGVTWSEGHTRLPSAALEQIEFVDVQTGWISGVSIDPLPRNAFFLLTNDGGKTWRQRPIFEESKFGAVSQFHFTSKTNGHMILDASQGKNIRQELYETNTGGESWEVKQTSNTPLRLPSPKPAGALNWRVRADAASRTYTLERGGGRVWEPVASFVIHVADCE